jgi:8-oxo-dGTP diphosphatase
MPKSEQGAVGGRYSVIPRTLIFITRGEKILLLKGAPTKRLWPDKYNGIGGHIERGEDVVSSARRELYEETGLEVDGLWLCGTVMVDAGSDFGITIFVMRGEYKQGEAIGSKEGSLEWILKADLDKFPLVEDVPVLLEKIFSMRAESPPFSARFFYNEEEELQIYFGF